MCWVLIYFVILQKYFRLLKVMPISCNEANASLQAEGILK
jgi:hypothetical protein